MADSKRNIILISGISLVSVVLVVILRSGGEYSPHAILTPKQKSGGEDSSHAILTPKQKEMCTKYNPRLSTTTNWSLANSLYGPTCGGRTSLKKNRDIPGPLPRSASHGFQQKLSITFAVLVTRCSNIAWLRDFIEAVQDQRQHLDDYEILLVGSESTNQTGCSVDWNSLSLMDNKVHVYPARGLAYTDKRNFAISQARFRIFTIFHDYLKPSPEFVSAIANYPYEWDVAGPEFMATLEGGSTPQVFMCIRDEQQHHQRSQGPSSIALYDTSFVDNMVAKLRGLGIGNENYYAIPACLQLSIAASIPSYVNGAMVLGKTNTFRRFPYVSGRAWNGGEDMVLFNEIGRNFRIHLIPGLSIESRKTKTSEVCMLTPEMVDVMIEEGWVW
eukprot:CAMPEP_0197515208 /NCGR_PEP_ID=MMETSP1318-20131121/409_1 /TAXON_ID=552666 /ORGANISM="Partenskyella glossopodia, Strain RCC365" /LENGTH=386 /DNA_ID=CAMNT_0043063515 /DNA_START=143 /DNA_END=1300 /DNA_ORIENTATION=-